MRLSYFCPSWSRVTLVAVLVFELKNVSQFFLISATAAAEPLADGAGAAGTDAAGALVAGADGDDVAAELELELLLAHAVSVAAMARPSAGMISLWHRIRCGSPW